MKAPKEKAKALVERFMDNSLLRLERFEAIQCALSCVDEILKVIDEDEDFCLFYFWQEVKQEIEKL
jgi:hypothetical protein